MSLTPGTRLGPYEITGVLGEGGMGKVYKARDTRLDRAVAIKVLPEHVALDPVRKQRFEQEARMVAALSHPHVCQLYDIGVERETSAGPPIDYLVLEYLEGETLAARMGRSPLPVAEAVQQGLVLLGALEALHRQGVVHRDLKPANVFLTEHGLKLLDFGLARTLVGEPDLTADLTQPGTVMGTPRYIAPEVLRGQTADAKADLFAMGALLYEMIGGRPAFDGGSPIDIASAVLNSSPPILAGSAAIAAADRVIHRALEKNPGDRYESASAMSSALRSVLTTSDATHPVQAQAVRRLIVLPFRMLRPDPDTDFLCFSLPDAITTSLSSVRSLVVRSPVAAGPVAPDQPDLKELADRTQVDLVLLGALLRGGDVLQVSAQLVEAPAGTVVWSDRYRVDWSDIFKLQEDLTTRIVSSLQVPLSSDDERTAQRDVPATPRAYEYYLRARQLDQAANTTSEWNVARDMYLRCVDEDPNYAPAWARLGRIHRVIAKFVSRSAPELDAGYAGAGQAFDRAFGLNPRLDVAHNLFTGLELERGKSRDAMIRLLGRVSESGGTADLFAGLVSACRYCGLLEASMVAHRHARRLDPFISTGVVNTLYLMGSFSGVLDHPDTDTTGGLLKAECLIRLGRASEVDELMDRWDAQSGEGIRRSSDYRRGLAGGNPEDPRVCTHLRYTDLLPDPEAHFLVACSTAMMGLSDHSLERLQRAVDGGHVCYPAIANDPWLDSLRTNPEFIRLMRLAESKHRAAAAAFVEAGGDRLLGV